MAKKTSQKTKKAPLKLDGVPERRRDNIMISSFIIDHLERQQSSPRALWLELERRFRAGEKVFLEPCPHYLPIGTITQDAKISIPCSPEFFEFLHNEKKNGLGKAVGVQRAFYLILHEYLTANIVTVKQPLPRG